MNDARFITNYMESRVFEQYIRNINKLDSAQDYKNFLQKNAESIMERERTVTESNNKCSLNEACPPIGTYSPALNSNGSTQSNCARKPQ
jgi:hypothetical protein